MDLHLYVSIKCFNHLQYFWFAINSAWLLDAFCKRNWEEYYLATQYFNKGKMYETE